jgi:ATP-binding cassette subfamily F protein uup
VNYLRAENISKHYGERTLFENITIHIESGDKVALVARNGAGKSTLLNILAGADESDSGGTVVRSKDANMLFLQQEPELNENDTVWKTLFNNNDALLKVIADYERLMEHNADADATQLQQVLDEMERLQAWDYESRVKQILTRLRIHDFEQPVSTLSGGQRKRLALARVLIQNPDLLILDEPTNHLDLDMIAWLEGYLKSNAISLLMVTHDRYFLDNVCNKIIELENGKVYTHKGNYAYYLEQKELREFNQNREADKARNLLKKELEWMRRQPKARGTKSKSRIEAFYELQDKASKTLSDKQVQLSMEMQRLGGKIMEMKGVNKRFGEKLIVNDFSCTLKPGERIGIVGRNGVGKSTFLNIMMGLEQPDSGIIEYGDTLNMGYYAQQGMKLSGDKRVIEVVKDIAEYMDVGKGERITASQLCKRFLFDDKMQHTFVSKLSGGEKRRLFLLTILVKNPNFLIMDEPTNDLDIQTLNVLEEFLENYKGCLLMVTHDRYFMDKLVDHLWVFEGDGAIRDFNGNYQDYLDEQAVKTELAKPVSSSKSAPEKPKPKNQLTYNEKREYEQLCIDLEKLQARKVDLETQLSQPDLGYEQITQLAGELEQLKQTLDEKELRWLELEEKQSNT